MNNLTRVISTDKNIRGFFIDSKQIVVDAKRLHGYINPVAVAGLGRLLGIASIMGVMMKSPTDCLTIRVDGDGPMKGLLVTATSDGLVRGYVYNDDYVGYARFDGKLDVGGSIGNGTITVIKDLGLKEPYNSTTPLLTGEIADDMTYYFATSEQTPTSVGAGVLFDKETGEVDIAGAFIIQLLPSTPEEVIAILEENIAKVKSVTDIIKENGIEGLMNIIFEDIGYDIVKTYNTDYKCNCSRERMERALMSLPKSDITEMIEDDEGIELNCHFCNRKYQFTTNELENLCEHMK